MIASGGLNGETAGGLLDAVKAATWDLHMRAERSGVISAILKGRADRADVALLMRNLLPVYQALDSSWLGHPALARSAAIEADLRVLSPDIEARLLPEGRVYAERVALAAAEEGSGLAAHAYVRYLGDLNGGMIMKRRLTACIGDTASALTAHDYPMLRDTGAFTRAYRDDLDRAARVVGLEVVIREAIIAFELNIALSEAVWAQSSRFMAA